MRKDYDLKEDFAPRTIAVQRLRDAWLNMRDRRKDLSVAMEKVKELERRYEDSVKWFTHAGVDPGVTKDDIMRLTIYAGKDEEDSDNTE